MPNTHRCSMGCHWRVTLARRDGFLWYLSQTHEVLETLQQGIIDTTIDAAGHM